MFQELVIYKLINPFFCISFTDLVHCTNEPNVSIPHLANLLVERSQNANWVVVYKALISAHHLLAYGNEVRRDSQRKEPENALIIVFYFISSDSFNT